jgi:hypothetical protein
MSRESPAIIIAAIATAVVVAMFSRSLWTPSHDHDARAASVASRVQAANPVDAGVAPPRDALPSRVVAPAEPKQHERRASNTEALGLWFSASKSATVGSTVDLETMGALRAPDTTAIEVSYDPAVLHVRSTEERDYRDDAVAYGGFHVDDESPGLVRLIPQREVLTVIERSGRRAGLVQFEPLAVGASRIEVRMVPPDSSGAQPPCDCDVMVLPTR